MNAKIAELLREKIEDLNFIERTAGLVRSLPIKVPTDDGGMITKNIPIYQNNEDTCDEEEMMALVPDSSKKSIVFFEDGGIDIESKDTRFIHCRSTINMVAWFNLPMINETYTDATLLMAKLISTIPKYITNEDFVTGIMVTPRSFLPKDSVYAQYDLDLAENMYFAYPYDYSAFSFDIVFRLPMACLDAITLDPLTCI